MEKHYSSHGAFRRVASINLIFVYFVVFYSSVCFAQIRINPATDLKYAGAFRVPAAGIDYGGNALAYNPANHSLIIAGHVVQNQTLEISIPTRISSSTNINDLSLATVIQTPKDATNGTLSNIFPDASAGQKYIYGHLVYNNKLIVSAVVGYDASCSQNKSVWRRSLDLSNSGETRGPVAVSQEPQSRLAGYMATIPSNYRSAFGYPALIGIAGLSISSCRSNGPTAVLFDPDAIATSDPTPGVMIVGYPQNHPLVPDDTAQNQLWVQSSTVRGAVFPEKSRTVLFYGRHALGSYCYGDTPPCTDPCYSAKGQHMYPYAHYLWAYDALDLLAVKNGTKNYYDVKPYYYGEIKFPFGSADCADAGGMAYDALSNRIYISAMYHDGVNPIIYVFDIVNTELAPESPKNLRIRGN